MWCHALFLSKVSGIVSSNILAVPLMPGEVVVPKVSHKSWAQTHETAQKICEKPVSVHSDTRTIRTSHSENSTAKGGAKELWKGLKGGSSCKHVNYHVNWSGVGGDDHVPCTCTHVECYATGLGRGGGWSRSLDLRTCWTFLALVHMLNATQLVVPWGGGTCISCCTCHTNGLGGDANVQLAMLGWGGGDDNVPCTCTHVECYATGLGGVGGMITFHALVHMLNATQLVWGGVGGW